MFIGILNEKSGHFTSIKGSSVVRRGQIRSSPVSAKSKSAADTGGHKIVRGGHHIFRVGHYVPVRRTESESAELRRGQLCIRQCTWRTSTWRTPTDVPRSPADSESVRRGNCPQKIVKFCKIA